MSTPLPQYISLPSARERCPFTSLRRGRLYLLCIPCKGNKFKPAVKGAKQLKEPGRSTGTWLIPSKQLMAYIDGLPEGNTND